MSDQLILYVGKPEAGATLAALAAERNDYVYLPDNLMQALGMYIAYFPQITIIDMAVDYAQETLAHLISVDAEPLIVLTKERVRSTAIWTLPPDSSAEAVLETVERLAFDQPQDVSNGVLHDA